MAGKRLASVAVTVDHRVRRLVQRLFWNVDYEQRAAIDREAVALGDRSEKAAGLHFSGRDVTIAEDQVLSAGQIAEALPVPADVDELPTGIAVLDTVAPVARLARRALRRSCLIHSTEGPAAHRNEGRR